MTRPVTIIMPCRNGARRLRTALESVRAQTFPAFEVVFVDDGSTDDSAELVASLGDARITVVRQAHAGVSAARNRGLAEAHGEFIAFLDADDTWHPGFLENMVGALRAQPAAVLAYCGWQNVGLSGPRGAPFVPPDYERPDKACALLACCPWPIHAALSRSQAVRRAGGFEPSLAFGEDFLLWLEVGTSGQIVRVPEVLAYYHHHGGPQATHDRLRACLQSLRAQQIFLDRHPALARQLGRGTVRELTLGRLRERALQTYWDGDLRTARALFRRLMASGYGRGADLKYMLPSLLPLGLHQRAIGLARSLQQTQGQDGAQ